MDSNVKEVLDLSTCRVCFNEFDVGERKPKFLDCHHTFCATCITDLVPKWQRPLGVLMHINVTCPLCRQSTKILRGKGVESLRNNPYPLHLLKSMKMMDRSSQSAPAKEREYKNLQVNPECAEKRHCCALIGNRTRSDVQEIQALFATFKNNLAEAIKIRQETRTYLERILRSVQWVKDSIRNEIESNNSLMAELVSTFQPMKLESNLPVQVDTFTSMRR